MVFGHIDKFWKGHGGQIKKNACKNTYLYGLFSYSKIKGCVFGLLVILTNFGKDMADKLRKMHMQKHVFIGSIFIPEKCMFRVCFESPFTKMIYSLTYKCPSTCC